MCDKTDTHETQISTTESASPVTEHKEATAAAAAAAQQATEAAVGAEAAAAQAAAEVEAATAAQAAAEVEAAAAAQAKAAEEVPPVSPRSEENITKEATPTTSPKEATPPTSPKEATPPPRLAEGNMAEEATPPPPPEDSCNGGTPPRPRLVIPIVLDEDSLSPDNVVYTPEAAAQKLAEMEAQNTAATNSIDSPQERPPKPNEIKCTPKSRACAIQ